MPRTAPPERDPVPTRAEGTHAAGPRLLWVDVARGLALVSMMVAHTAPTGGPGGVLNLSEHLTAALFAALVGASAGLDLRRHGLGRTLACALVRALALALCARLVDGWDAQIADILPHLAVLTVLMALLAALPLGAQLVLALVVGTAGVPLAEAGPVVVADALAPLAAALPLAPGTLTGWTEEFLTGPPYRLPTLLTWGLLGAVLVRTVHAAGTTGASRARAARLTGLWWGLGGVALAGAVLWLSHSRTGETPAPYSGTIPEVLVDTGLAVAVLGLCAAVVPARRSPAVDLLAVPGAMTLSVYVAQHAWLGWAVTHAPGPWVSAQGTDDTWFNVAVLIAGAIGLPLAWHALVRARPWGAGPLEGVVRLVTDRIGGR